MGELLPLGSGFVIGLLLASMPERLRLPLGAVLVVAAAVIATVVNGEAGVSGWFLLFDLALVAVAAAAGLLGASWLRAARRG